METIFRLGRWFIITVVLLSLTGYAPPNRSSRQEDAQVAILVRLARTNLQARLGVPAEGIALESTRPLILPCPTFRRLPGTPAGVQYTVGCG